ncbi:MAG: hypothetical protein N0C84_13205 [Candidatus Thiodiazotropha taylori]|uniref:Uncharacterized protein n=1 Tax=Candidatus Thiodiazotropha taylori TaxID=2792791 RepID=A0A9E4KDN1_9GAMM|nr:hypothetical protein [Candidatus Thiodiazotropha taylori]MCW4257415.1 hypothetical protein [Candidatus Thiodiazotropha taylori]
MKYRNMVFLIAGSLILGACQSTGPSKQWSMQEKLERFSAQSHHWGQKGQSTPNNGWSEYGHLKVEMGGPERIQVSQNNGELLGQVITNQTGKEKVAGLSIPGAGLFYRPKSSSTCRPDAIEQIGIYAEMALNYLATAYPGGPNQQLAIGKKEYGGPAAEIRFMQAVARLNNPWSAEIEVKESKPGNHVIEITEQNKKMHVHWLSEQQEVVGADSSIEEWLTCWSGVRSQSPSGEVSFETRIKNPDLVSTFGEVRTQLGK